MHVLTCAVGSIPDITGQAGAADEFPREGVENATLGAYRTAGVGIAGVQGWKNCTRGRSALQRENYVF